MTQIEERNIDEVIQELLDTVDKMNDLRLKLNKLCDIDGLEGDTVIDMLNEITDGEYETVEEVKARIEELKLNKYEDKYILVAVAWENKDSEERFFISVGSSYDGAHEYLINKLEEVYRKNPFDYNEWTVNNIIKNIHTSEFEIPSEEGAYCIPEEFFDLFMEEFDEEKEI